MIRRLLVLLVMGWMAFGAGCSNEATSPTSPSPGGTRVCAYVFSDGPQGWVGDMAHYYTWGADARDSLVVDYRPLETPLDTTKPALFITGAGGSFDLSGPLLYFKRRVDGFSPLTEYDTTFTVEIATDTPYGCNGLGGQPGENTYVKSGAAATEPVLVLSGDYYGMSIDTGYAETVGDDVTILGNLANSTKCTFASGEVLRKWELKALASTVPLRVKSASDGSIWLFLGADSRFAGFTRYYLTAFSAVFRPGE